MHDALFHRSHEMKTFDVSVNVLNNNVLSDKLLWKERATVSIARAADRPPEIASLHASTHASIQPESQAPVCTWRPPELRLEMILLLLPFTFMISFIIVFQFGSNKPLVSTLVGCALVLSTPAILMLAQQKRTCVKIDMYVHILLLHAAGLLTILHSNAMLGVFIVFVLVFAHLGWQNTGKRADIIKDYKGKAVLYYFAAVVNAITLGVLLQYQQSAAHNTFMGVDTWFVVVVLLSLAVYVADNYI
jgi:hypothetical protein